MSLANRNTLSTCIYRTRKRVAFALGRKLLREFTNPSFQNWNNGIVFSYQRGIHGESSFTEGFPDLERPRQGWPIRICFRYNSKT